MQPSYLPERKSTPARTAVCVVCARTARTAVCVVCARTAVCACVCSRVCVCRVIVRATPHLRALCVSCVRALRCVSCVRALRCVVCVHAVCACVCSRVCVCVNCATELFA